MFKVVWNEKRVLNLFFDVLNIFNMLFYWYIGNKMLEIYFYGICSLILNSILILMLIILENYWDFFINKKNRFKMNGRK